MHFWHDGWHMTGWHFMWMAVWWALILGGIIWVIWSIGNRPRLEGPNRESPEEILKKRYARGEIDSEEFRNRLKELKE